MENLKYILESLLFVSSTPLSMDRLKTAVSNKTAQEKARRAHEQTIAQAETQGRTLAAQIGYVLAQMEGHPEPEKIATMLIFHDIAECRVGDIHRVAHRYVGADEEQAVEDQTRPLGEAGKRANKQKHGQYA